MPYTVGKKAPAVGRSSIILSTKNCDHIVHKSLCTAALLVCLNALVCTKTTLLFCPQYYSQKTLCVHYYAAASEAVMAFPAFQTDA